MARHVVTAKAGLLHVGDGDPKKKRDMLLLGGGLVLVMLLYMRHRSSAAAAATAAAPVAATDPAASSSAPGGTSVTPSTFADNGAQAGALGDSVTNGLSGVQTSLDAQTSAFQTYLDSQQAAGTVGTIGGVGQPAGTSSYNAPAAAQYYAPPPASAPAPTPAPPRPAPVAAGGPGVKVNTQAHSPRAGKTYSTVHLSGGRTEHVYASGKKVVVPATKKR